MLTALAAFLSLAVVAGPQRIAEIGSPLTQAELAPTLRTSFVAFLGSGAPGLPGDLSDAVGYWLTFHAVKAVLATALLIVLVMLATVVWRRFVGAGDRSRIVRAGLWTSAVAVSGIGFLALVIALANLQGVVAPLSSLLAMLHTANPDPALGAAVDQAAMELTGALRDGTPVSAPLATLLADSALYHRAMAWIAGAAGVVFAALAVGAVRAARRVERAQPRARRTLWGWGVASAVTSALWTLIAVANASSAATPIPPLLGFFVGGL